MHKPTHSLLSSDAPMSSGAPSSSDAEHVVRARRAIREALDVLALPPPDTFLGRKSYEPFPKEQLDPAEGQGDANGPEVGMTDPWSVRSLPTKP